jgi:hypothetical protein
MPAELPPPDPSEQLGTPGLSLAAPTVYFTGGPPSPQDERLADAVLAVRPGALIVISPR